MFVHVEAEDGSHTPDRITILGIADIVEEFFRAVIVSGPGPAAGGDPSGFEVFLIVVEGSEVLIDMLQDTIGGFAVPAEDGEVKFVVFEATDGEREVDLEGSNAGVYLICDGGIGGIGCAHFFEFGEDAVALVDVAGVELEMFLVGFIGNFACFSLHFGEKGFLLVGVGMGHGCKYPAGRSRRQTGGWSRKGFKTFSA